MPELKLTAVFMKVPEGYVAYVEEVPGANTQGETLDKARANLREAVTMVLEANRELSRELEKNSFGDAEVFKQNLLLAAA